MEIEYGFFEKFKLLLGLHNPNCFWCFVTDNETNKRYYGKVNLKENTFYYAGDKKW